MRLSMWCVGSTLVWTLDGDAAHSTPGERMELAFAFWRMVTRAGTVSDAYAVLFPETDGGLLRGGPRNGVAHVHRN